MSNNVVQLFPGQNKPQETMLQALGKEAAKGGRSEKEVDEIIQSLRDHLHEAGCLLDDPLSINISTEAMTNPDKFCEEVTDQIGPLVRRLMSGMLALAILSHEHEKEALRLRKAINKEFD
ncbi:MAG: hypothetical protein DRQ65_08640 [Gammaproteobacteria bacterium]|nr:MAG: hypothetical protein DRQ65_08640 [Gammaproteobacteria bacterium]